MNRVYKKKNFNLYQFGKEYIIHNTKGEFSKNHTHINDFKTAKFLIDLAIHKSVPRHLSFYLMNSLIRISLDKKYIDKLESEIRRRTNRRNY